MDVLKVICEIAENLHYMAIFSPSVRVPKFKIYDSITSFSGLVVLWCISTFCTRPIFYFQWKATEFQHGR